jgi:hypothetical protein
VGDARRKPPAQMPRCARHDRIALRRLLTTPPAFSTPSPRRKPGSSLSHPTALVPGLRRDDGKEAPHTRSLSNVSFRSAERFVSLRRAARGEESGWVMGVGAPPPSCLAALGLTAWLYDRCETAIRSRASCVRQALQIGLRAPVVVGLWRRWDERSEARRIHSRVAFMPPCPGGVGPPSCAPAGRSC